MSLYTIELDATVVMTELDVVVGGYSLMTNVIMLKEVL